MNSELKKKMLKKKLKEEKKIIKIGKSNMIGNH